MSSYAGDQHAPPGGSNRVTGLEGQLRNMILNNSPGPSEDRSQYVPMTAPVPAPGGGHVVVHPAGYCSSPQGSAEQAMAAQEANAVAQRNAAARRRPNQAQRRQMSSQLSIPVDTRPAHQSSNWRGFDNGPSQGNQHGHFPRHQHTMSHPNGNADHFRARQQTQSPWNDGPATPRNGSSFHQNSSSFLTGHQGPNRGGHFEHRPRHNPGMSQGYRRQPFTQEEIINQSVLLEELSFEALMSSEIDRSGIAEKESFRQRIEAICRQVISEHEWHTNANAEFPPPSVELKCFGSLSSGFATKSSDMDLGLLSPFSGLQPDAPGSPIPRLIEKAFLDAGIGARLLSRTRVPIIKLCESPPETLLRDLLAQREKWENGLDQDHTDSHDEDDQAGDHNSDVKDEESAQATEGNSSPDYTSFQVPDEKGQSQGFHLRQTSKHNLAAYYGLAKRVLRKAGGRDVTMSNSRELSPHDWTVLNLVCRAFVHGLADANLRRSLSKYPSLAFELDSGFPHNRSLLGVSVQVEGEQILHQWQNWSIAGDLLALEPFIEQYVGYWYEVQRRQNFGQDPMSYTKELQLALDKMKKLPPFQLLLLEQSQQESVTQYYQRTRIIIKHLKVSTENNTDSVRRETVNKYIDGICYEDVRSDMKVWQVDTDTWDLDAISYKHKALHLAGELARALDKKLYDDAVAPDVKRYIEVLRCPLQQTTNAAGKRSFIIPITDNETVQLITRIKTLPDPHKMAPNQPRDKYRDPLEFPKDGAGAQCDINFSAHLALENTTLLRCYSLTDPRVRAMVLFIKHWAKVRGINSGYRGTLSSYGYVLMVLHYLVNIASPFVCPNLQHVGPPEEQRMCKGYNVKFWRDEQMIVQLARDNRINQNQQTIGYLLRGFFEYYAQNGSLSTVPGRGFDWGRDVLSLRSPGGLLTKQEKGWTGAKTVYQAQDPNEPSIKPPTNSTDSPQLSTVDPATGAPKGAAVKEVRLRYLFAVEDPFELEHNVARTVTHNGIVSIRDEFRRAWRIIQAAGHGLPHDNLLQDVNDVDGGINKFIQSIDDIHGLEKAANV
ncbi:hypothetical protein NLG97_g4677 [Lecanicillium saksenae]|uniref:Uncharacterized protein n=1 Tax=Lecanicillium saksenae TaxID=468837 RepID=A0ACC1QWB8_9HYPO|nr:hypothetical protein NLG97_g4677 [Lecanicillium saksenae]